MNDWWRFDMWAIQMGINLGSLQFSCFLVGVLMMFPIVFWWRSGYLHTIERHWAKIAHLDLALKIIKDNLDQVPGTHVQHQAAYNRIRELIEDARNGRVTDTRSDKVTKRWWQAFESNHDRTDDD